MIARIFVGVGLFAVGYFVGKEMGRAEYIRDQLRWTGEDGELTATHRDAADKEEPRDSDSGTSGGASPAPEQT